MVKSKVVEKLVTSFLDKRSTGIAMSKRKKNDKKRSISKIKTYYSK